MQRYRLCKVFCSLLLSAIIFAACSGGGGGGSSSPPPPKTGSISGMFGISNQFPILTTTVTASSDIEQVDIVPGEIIVAFKSGVNEKTAIAALLTKYKDVGLVNAGPVYPNGPFLFRTIAYHNNKISTDEAKKQTREIISKLSAEPDIQYAEPNDIAKPQMMPNNPVLKYGFQWDMNMINLPTAWELTQGSSSVIVAVLDTGIRSHPSLDPNVLSTGYNFVDMNSDPTEPLAPIANFHGTHVAGTIAAIGNTGYGIAGVAWNVKIMPVRVLGSLGSGQITSIANGMLYAAGLPNSSGTLPPQHANVINMSLGGPSTCSQTYQSVINQVINAGVTIVASAGNSYQSGNPVMSPASCQGVIAVGALDPNGNRASYSESKPYVFIAAPGGEVVNNQISEGILSTFPISTPGGPYYRYMSGTSMAAPHVSGVIGLMYSVNASLTPTQVQGILGSTANPLGNVVPNNDIGYGMIDAGKAVAAAQGVPMPSVAVPYPSPSLINFDQIFSTRIYTEYIYSLGSSTLMISSVTPTVSNPSGGTWLSAVSSPSCSAIPPMSYCPITITINPAGLPTDQYIGNISVASNAGDFYIPVMFRIGATPIVPITTPITVELWSVDSTTGAFENLVATTTTNANASYSFAFQSVPPGNNYYIAAGIDTNSDGVFGNYFNEVFSFGGVLIPVVAGQTTPVTGITLHNPKNDIVSGI